MPLGTIRPGCATRRVANFEETTMQTKRTLETALSRVLAARAAGNGYAEAVCWSYLMDDWEPHPQPPGPGDGEPGPVIWPGMPVR